MRPRPLRADARDSRRRLLEAARDVFIERGPPPRSMRSPAGPGPGSPPCTGGSPTAWALVLREAVRDALQRTIDEARRAAEEEPDPFRALALDMHRAIDVRTAAVIPALLGEIPFEDEEIRHALGNRARHAPDPRRCRPPGRDAPRRCHLR